jgi:YegS/Rv2252/BmrU family lipid kinase
VLAIGGDGTVHEVVNGLMAAEAERRPPLGIVPAGSGNDVAFALEINKDLDRSILMLESGQTRAIDVGHILASSGKSCYAINNVGLLLEGEINLASHRLHWPRGSGLYVRAMLQTLLRPLPCTRLELTLDGEQRRREALLLSIANGARSGGRFFLTENALIDDGRFNYVLARRVGRLRLLGMAMLSMRGRPPQANWIEQGQFSTMTLKAQTPLAAHVDGEPWLAPQDEVLEVAVKVLPRALQVLAPPRSTDG